MKNGPSQDILTQLAQLKANSFKADPLKRPLMDHVSLPLPPVFPS